MEPDGRGEPAKSKREKPTKIQGENGIIRNVTPVARSKKQKPTVVLTTTTSSSSSTGASDESTQEKEKPRTKKSNSSEESTEKLSIVINRIVVDIKNKGKKELTDEDINSIDQLLEKRLSITPKIFEDYKYIIDKILRINEKFIVNKKIEIITKKIFEKLDNNVIENYTEKVIEYSMFTQQDEELIIDFLNRGTNNLEKCKGKIKNINFLLGLSLSIYNPVIIYSEKLFDKLINLSYTSFPIVKNNTTTY
jgi:hypothetical protein